VGGGGFEEGTGVAVDGDHAAYVSGTTKSLDGTFPTSIGPRLTTKATTGTVGADGIPFLAKIANTGSVLGYSGFLGDFGVSTARVGVDAGGNAYVTARGSV